MKNSFLSLPVIIALPLFLGLIVTGCEPAATTGEKNGAPDSLAIKEHLTSPVLSPQAAISKMHIEKGFAVKLVAAEPLVTAPVAMTFDEQGRIWVVEMQGYMPDTVGTGENRPAGDIAILTDTNGDGVMDHREVFLDSLVLPRAICLIDSGVLVAESPKLWYYKIENDRPVKKELVDSAYTQGGNVEHEPNGLLLAMDNWIYSAKFDKRYRKKGQRWLIEKTHFRGQWGITQDDNGRLYYNTNSENLLGDYFSPGLGATNPYQRRVAGFSENIVPDNRVYPAHPTPGVNRGYMAGILDDSLRLVNFTAACGPLIYNGQWFGDGYQGNAFVAEPSANLIKRNVLTDSGFRTVGRQAYAGKEFLASEDERFRPVSLYTGADGALYVVDMYRGIIQHKTYLTTYLKNEIKDRSLTQPLNTGRIYKVVPERSPLPQVTFEKNAAHLLALLNHPNGWVRQKAQQLLIEGKYSDAVPALRNNLTNTAQPLLLIHSLWTLEGLNELSPAAITPLLQQPDWTIRRQAWSVLPSLINRKNYPSFLAILEKKLREADSLDAPYMAYALHSVQPFNKAAANKFLMQLAQKYPGNIYVADAIISNLFNQEKTFYQILLRSGVDTSATIAIRLKKVMADMENAKNNANTLKAARAFPEGAALFQSTCQGCHGKDGNGTPSLAPPLNGSEWVRGNSRPLISIVLYGLTGPVRVAGKLYKSPEINGDMPGIGQNKEFSDEAIAEVLSYIRASWSNKAPSIKAEEITRIRQQWKERQQPFTMEELNKLK